MTAATFAVPEVSEEWRLQSLRDLEVAEALLKVPYYEWAAYAAQQAAEKAIKAVRYALAIDLHSESVFSHDLIKLALPLLQAYPTLLDKAELAVIKPHEADGRYPSPRTGPYLAPLKAYEEPVASRAVVIARSVVDRCSTLTLSLQEFWRTRPTTCLVGGGWAEESFRWYYAVCPARIRETASIDLEAVATASRCISRSVDRYSTRSWPVFSPWMIPCSAQRCAA